MKTHLSGAKTLTFLLLAIALPAASSRAALFEDFFLNASGNAVWENDLNWSTTTYPNNGHTRPDTNGDPIPGPNPTYNAVLEMPTLCTLGIGVTVEAVTIATGAGLGIISNGVLKVNGPLANNGTILMQSSGIVAEMVLSNGSTIEPGGVVTMGTNINNNIYAMSHGDTLTIKPGGTIHGSGQLNIGFFGDTRHLLKFINHGVIQADQASLPLYVAPDDSVNASMVNGGTLQAQNGATLVLRAFSASGTVSSSNGFIQAWDGSTVRVDTGVTVDGGTLITEGTGAIRGTGGGGAIKNVTNTGTIAVGENESIGLGGNIVNDGVIRMDAPASGGSAYLTFAENTTLAGNGVLTMSDSDHNGFFARAGVVSLTIGPNATIEGSGTLWAYLGGNQSPLNITNQGLIHANHAAHPLLVYLTNNTPIMENTGILRASAGATLNLLSNSATVTLNNGGGGRIEALENSTVSVGNGVTIEGGTVSTIGDGVIRGAGGGLSNVTNTGTVVSAASATLYLANTFTNNGVLQIDQGYGVITGDINLAGNGTLVMSGGGIFSATGNGHTMTIGSESTIKGWGTLGIYLGGNQQPLNYVNHGLIHANDPAHPINIFSAGALPTFPNTGTLRASDGATIQLIGNGSPVTLTNEGGTIDVLTDSAFNTQSAFGAAQNSGTINLDGSMTIPSGLDLNGGELIGDGTFVGAIRNHGGSVRPGHSPGKLTVTGNYTQEANGVLDIEIGGRTAVTEYDQLAVSGAVTLDGTLNVTLINGFRPNVGDVFQIIANGSFTGSFAAVHFTGFTGQISYAGGAITITVLTVPDIPLNISTRLGVATDPNQLIGGLIITGSQPKRVLIRGIGPSLGAFVSGALADPTLELFDGSTLLESNNDWKESNQSAIEATGIAPTDDHESAIVRTLDPGAYTAIMRGSSGGTGIGVVEAYDLDQAASSKMANISTRGFVDTGDNAMIGGFIMGGNGGENGRVVVRAIGPSLGDFGISGALQDSVLELRDSSGSLVASNDNWQDSQQTEIEATGLAPTDTRESVIVMQLTGGGYTAVVRGKDNTTGVAVVEVYNIL